VVSTVRADDDVSVAMKFVSASQAQKNGVWSSIRWEDRAARIRDFAERVRDDAGEIASIITAETGKPATQSRMEVNASARRVTDLVAM
jgi:acyl-CoA reductase-like NAD-dependent aldehyde dehydrogenase